MTGSDVLDNHRGCPAYLTSLPTVKLSIAGGRLFNVVVQNEKVGSDLLKKGGLRKRVTLIPLNKITPRTIAPEVSSASLTIHSEY